MNHDSSCAIMQTTAEGIECDCGGAGQHPGVWSKFWGVPLKPATGETSRYVNRHPLPEASFAHLNHAPEVALDYSEVRRVVAAPDYMLHHKSDCAIHNEPAMPTAPCDCGAWVNARRDFDRDPYDMDKFWVILGSASPALVSVLTTYGGATVKLNVDGPGITVSPPSYPTADEVKS